MKGADRRFSCARIGRDEYREIPLADYRVNLLVTRE